MLVWMRVAAEGKKVYQVESTGFGIWIWPAENRTDREFQFQFVADTLVQGTEKGNNYQ